VLPNPEINPLIFGVLTTWQTMTTCLARVVKRGVNALKNLQVKGAQIEAKFYEEVHDLERKYAVLYQPLFDKQSEIINTIYEPTEEECEWKPDEEDKISEELKEKNVDLPSDMLQEHDEPILKHVKDTKVKFSDAGQPMSFVLEFHFEPSEYFTNEVLTKTYRMRLEPEPDDSDPFSFDGQEIMGCTGGHIDWKKGKNAILKTIKQQQKHKGHGTIRIVTKTSGDLDDDAEAILAADFKIGHFLREQTIPRSVEDDDDEYDEEGEEADEEEEDKGDEENDPDYDPKKDQNPAECKQQ
uniref:Nucleosome assembly protein 1 like 1 n=1 Tax=Gorilla gorilla gorilla TaxID=9595 RepID=G3RUK0_GORGO